MAGPISGKKSPQEPYVSPAEESKCPFDKIPDELLERIFDYLNKGEELTVRKVNRRWRQVVERKLLENGDFARNALNEHLKIPVGRETKGENEAAPPLQGESSPRFLGRLLNFISVFNPLTSHEIKRIELPESSPAEERNPPLPDLWEKLPFTHFSFRNGQVTDEVMTEIAKKTSLKSLVLARCDLTEQHLQSLAQLTGLEELDLQYSSIQEQKALILMTVLPNLRRLRILNLRTNYLFTDRQSGDEMSPSLLFPVDKVEDFWRVIMGLPDLESLDLAWNFFSNGDIQALSRVIMELKNRKSLNLLSLKSLDLAKTKMDFDGVQALKAILEECVHLRSLNLSYNKLTFEGINSLMPALRELEELKSLDLRHTGLTPEEKERVRTALPKAQI